MNKKQNYQKDLDLFDIVNDACNHIFPKENILKQFKRIIL